MTEKTENKSQPMPSEQRALILRVSHSAYVMGDYGDDAVNIWTCELLNLNGKPLDIEPIDDDVFGGDIDGRGVILDYIIRPSEIESGEFTQGDMVPPVLRGMIEDNFAELARGVRGL